MSPFDIENIDASIRFSSKNDLPSEHKPLFNDQPLLHEEFEVFFVAAGEVSWFIENEMHGAEPGSLVIFSDREVHKLHIRSNKRFERVKLLFNPELARSFGVFGYDLLSCFVDRPKGKGNIRRLSAQQSMDIMKLFDKMGQACANAGPESRLLKVIALLEILMFTNKVFGAGDGGEESPGLRGPLASVLDYVDNNLAGDLSLETIGQKCGISVYHLCRIFKKETGSTLHNYILYKRVAEAQRLLGEGWKPGQVSAMCGFGAMSRFVAAFKKVTGTSPSAFAKRKSV
ncbi:MAG TPA: AraC family transcriptional regulator [Rectinemataceae bacterium]|nr:AraC family transcriptional regulator [Rectinemataceae bacterium]